MNRTRRFAILAREDGQVTRVRANSTVDAGYVIFAVTRVASDVLNFNDVVASLNDDVANVAGDIGQR